MTQQPSTNAVSVNSALDSFSMAARANVVQQPADGSGFSPGPARFFPTVMLAAVVEMKYS